MSALVIGVGNPERGDDAVGLVVAERLRASAPENVAVLSLSGEPAALIEAWRGAERVLLVDSSCGDGPAGRVQRFEAHKRALPAALLRASTHSLGVAEAIELSRALGSLPAQLTVYCVEAESFEPGRALSAKVEAAIPALLRRLRGDASRLRRAAPGRAAAARG